MREHPLKRPVGDPDSLTEGWWEATREERLLVQRCRACGNHQHYPRALCTRCASTDLDYAPSTGRGEVHSFTVVHRPPHPAFEAPYVVALVRIEEGPLFVTNLVGCDPGEVRCDMPVTVAWEPLPDGRNLPVFTPSSEPEGS